jgi:hypothetical protein
VRADVQAGEVLFDHMGGRGSCEGRVGATHSQVKIEPEAAVQKPDGRGTKEQMGLKGSPPLPPRSLPAKVTAGVDVAPIQPKLSAYHVRRRHTGREARVQLQGMGVAYAARAPPPREVAMSNSPPIAIAHPALGLSTPQPSPATSGRPGGRPTSGMDFGGLPLMSPMLMPQARHLASPSPRTIMPVGLSPSNASNGQLRLNKFCISPLASIGSAGHMVSISPMNVASSSPLLIQGSPQRSEGRLPSSPVVAYVNYMPPPMTPDGEYIPAPVGQARERCNCARTKCDTRRCKCFREKRPCVGCNCVDCKNLPELYTQPQSHPGLHVAPQALASEKQ